uniref:Sulfatase domain-containing protein n=1 Tax=Heterorhabditis bacteriophora TaxID=37862 RepID=A0A1I7WPI2_HETBA
MVGYDRDVLIWAAHPNLSDSLIIRYLEEAEARNMPRDKAMEILAHMNYDVDCAVKFCDNFVVPDLMCDMEKQIFCCAIDGERMRMRRRTRRMFKMRLMKRLVEKEDNIDSNSMRSNLLSPLNFGKRNDICMQSTSVRQTVEDKPTSAILLFIYFSMIPIQPRFRSVSVISDISRSQSISKWNDVEITVLKHFFCNGKTIVLLSSRFRKKNIVLIITDDQDIELGSMMYMPKTLKLMKDKGTEFSGGYVWIFESTCYLRFRSKDFSMYYRSIHENRSIGVYLKKAGYRTSYLGKYLNEYEGNYTPRGWDYWLGLVKNSKFYNYTVNMNGEKLRYGSNYEKDYFTDLIINRSLEFISDHIRNRPWQPFLSVLSYPAPHGPEDPAPQYSELTEAWNYAPNPDKQWLLQRTGKMEPVHVAFTDILHRRRMQTLQSVDEAVNRLFSLLRDYNQLSNTYVLYTSDHGYHLGQFGLIKGKNMPYEFDIRVPFFLRGPGVPKNVTIRRPVSNLDISPTLIDVAGVKVPEHMDGRSLLELISIHKGLHLIFYGLSKIIFIKQWVLRCSSSDDNDQDLLIDEFLLDSYQRNILNDRHWYQGSFHDDKVKYMKLKYICLTSALSSR